MRPFYVPWLPSYESIIYFYLFIKIAFILDTVLSGIILYCILIITIILNFNIVDQIVLKSWKPPKYMVVKVPVKLIFLIFSKYQLDGKYLENTSAEFFVIIRLTKVIKRKFFSCKRGYKIYSGFPFLFEISEFFDK